MSDLIVEKDPEGPQPIMVAVDYDTLNDAMDCLSTGVEYAKEALAEHDASLGRSIRKNRIWAEQIESEIRQMEKSLKVLEERLPNL
jgi:outer membrane translocation and assembly module TamA